MFGPLPPPHSRPAQAKAPRVGPLRAFFASLSLSLLVLALSYQAAALPAALASPRPAPPKSDAWMSHTEAAPSARSASDDPSELAPLLAA